MRALDGVAAVLPWAEHIGSARATVVKSAPKTTQVPAATGTAAPALRWKSVPGTAKYDVQVFAGSNLSAGGPQVLLKTGLTGTAFVPDTLVPGAYSWRVRRVDAGGNVLPWSAEPGAADVPIFSIGAQDRVRLTLPAANRAIVPADRTFRWTEVPGAVKYRVQLSTTPSFSTTVETADTAQTTFAPILTTWRARSTTGASCLSTRPGCRSRPTSRRGR